MCSQEPTTTTPCDLAVATYNIHGWIGRDRRRDAQRVLRVIRRLGCSIIALQEVTLELGGYQGSEHFLAQTTGMQVVNGPTLHDQRGSYGNALLTAHPVQAVRRLDLSLPGREPRGALEAELLVQGRALRVIACHLGLKAAERRRQVEMLLDFMGPVEGQRVVLMGDFNEWRPRSRILQGLNQRLGYSPSPATFPARMPCLRLDRIWASPPALLQEVSAHSTASARLASDHLPLIARLELG